MMLLKKLVITREPMYRIPQPDEDYHFICSITVEGDSGETTFKLDPEMSEKIIDLVAEQIVETTTRLAEQMTRSVFSQTTPQIEKS
jgi:hypothetical protein